MKRFLEINGAVVPVVIRKNSWAKRITLSVAGNRVNITMPRFARMADAHEIIKENAGWISEQLVSDHVENALFLGSLYKINFSGSRRIKIKGSFMHVSPGADVRHALENFYKKEAKKTIFSLVEQHNKKYNYKIGRIALRNQRTRWGSCSSRNNVNFNWRLMMAPLPVIEYIVVHELTHMTHRNHSRDFWSLVADRFPDYKECNRWLKKNGQLLNF